MINDALFSIIPQPLNLTPKEGYFELNDETVIYFDYNLQKEAEYFNNLLKPATGFNLILKELSKKDTITNCIVLRLINNVSQIGTEGYKLSVLTSKIEIESIKPNGIFYGIQTFRQLLPPEIESSQQVSIEWKIHCVEIQDHPRFSWRGFMLDEARHFFGKDIVKKVLDVMAFLKLNVFHWHLTDDQGWRVEIKKYPRLIEIGSKRKSTRLSIKRRKSDGIPYFGYYTQEDLKEIIEYAKKRHIKIIPEIDLPGHTTALLAAHPELSCTGGPFEVSVQFGIFKDVLCIGKDTVFNFVEDLLREIINIFPSEIIHIGGDEVPTTRWENCENCQIRIKNESLNAESDLQVYFTEQIINYLNALGKRSIGWNEILSEKLDVNTICQYWLGDFKQVLEHLKHGRNFVMSKMDSVYLNYGYKRLPLSKTYNYEPIPDNLNKKYHKHILGIEACLWSELIMNSDELEYHTFPRLIAVSETGWTTKEKRDFKFFQIKVTQWLKRLHYHNINYARENEWIYL